MKINIAYLFLFLFAMVNSCSDDKSIENENLSLIEIIGTIAYDLGSEVKSNNQHLSYLNNLVSVNTGDSLVSLVKSRHSIFLRISERHCGLCIESEIEEIKQLQLMLKKSSLAVLGTFSNKRSLRLLTEGLNSHDIPVFLVPEGLIDLPIEEVVSPYYFCLDESFSTNQMFLPLKGFPELTKSYFAAISFRH